MEVIRNRHGREAVYLKAVLTGLVLTAALTISACGRAGRAPMVANGPGLLPERIGETGWVKAPGMEHFRGDSLFEYIDGAAEMYHKYGFVEVTVARFLKGEYTITADIYLFESPDGAFGMYTTLRPDDPDTVRIGVEGFAFGSNVVFAKGAYLANIYTYDDFDSAVGAVRSVARVLEEGLQGTTAKPALFALFPPEGRTAHSEKIFAEGFLGYGFLTGVHTVDYEIDGVRARLFMADDPRGAMLAEWAESVGVTMESAPDWAGGIFGAYGYFRFTHDYYGDVMVGRRDGSLLGIVGYVPAYRDVLTGWGGMLQ